jgi:hypothetical protein
MAKNRQTKTVIEMSNEGDFISLICVDHNQSCDFETVTEARRFASSPIDWCGECASIILAKVINA